MSEGKFRSKQTEECFRESALLPGILLKTIV